MAEVESLGQRILCASTKQSSMLRARGTSGAVRALEVRKGPIRKAGEVQNADNDEREVLAPKISTESRAAFRVRDCVLIRAARQGLGPGRPREPNDLTVT